jgi:hypothetical protein
MPISPIISEQFNGSIWRMEIDEISDTLFVEVRDSEEKRVSFGAVNLASGDVYFKDLQTSERWLTGMETAYDGALLLHNYQTESGPAHRGLEAIDALTGKTLWSNYTYTFDYLSVIGPIIYDIRIQPRKLFLVDVKTGETTRIYEPSVYMELKNSVVLPLLTTPETIHQISNTTHHSPLTTHHSPLTTHLLPLASNLLPAHPCGNTIHYLEYSNFRIVSLHALRGGQLTQSIYIMDGVDKVYEDLLNTDIQKIQPEAFIMHKNRLIYIKNKSELKVLTL